MSNHKWGEYFRHEETWWKKCIKCGCFRIHLMGKPFYSMTGKLEDLSLLKPACTPMTQEEIDEEIKEIARKKAVASKKIEMEYNDPHSPHYRDNQRFSWAVKAILDNEKNDLEILRRRTNHGE